MCAATQKWVYHAVHMIFNGDFEPWEEEELHSNKLVFIGKNIDGAALRAGFEGCRATPENLDKKLKALRFKVGDRVECNMEGGVRKAGEVVQLMWRDDDMEQGQVCPYKVRASMGDCALTDVIVDVASFCTPTPCLVPSSSRVPSCPRQPSCAVRVCQVKLDDGEVTWTPADVDEVVRLESSKKQKTS